MKKIVSYSLWFQSTPMDGYSYQTHNMYYLGLVENLKILNQKKIYQGWKIRCYLNKTVPLNLQQNLTKLGCELIDMSDSKIPGMFWRFLVFQDHNVDIFVVRDTDSRINQREYKAVIHWLDSDKCLHIMRDHPHHYYKILGGMWGYKNYLQRLNILGPLDKFLKKKNYNFKRMDDMKFLDLIYDMLKGKSLEHDQFFNYPYSIPFPDNSYQKDYYLYVGEIYDEHNNPPNKERDRQLFKNKNYLKIIKGKNYK